MPDTLIRPVFPFTVLVGQQRMKRALILNTVNPKLGGVLVRGEKGTAKSTAVRGLANLLPEIDVLLDAAAMGVNYVEREGVSVQHPSQFILVGTMNPEEGDLRPQLLDRFALAVEVEGLDDPEARAEVVLRRIAFEQDPAGFLADWRQEEQAERLRIQRGQELLPEVRLDDRMLRLITQLCVH